MAKNRIKRAKATRDEIEYKLEQLIPLYRDYRNHPDRFNGLNLMAIEDFHGFSPLLKKRLWSLCKKELNFDPEENQSNEDIVLVSYGGGNKDELILRRCSKAIPNREIQGGDHNLVEIIGYVTKYKSEQTFVKKLGKQTKDKYIGEICALGAAFDSINYSYDTIECLNGAQVEAEEKNTVFFKYLKQWLATFDSYQKQKLGKSEDHGDANEDRISIKVTIAEFYKLLIVLERSGVIDKINNKTVAKIVKNGNHDTTIKSCRSTRSKINTQFFGKTEIVGRNIHIGDNLIVRVKKEV